MYENEFFHEIKCNGMTCFMNFMVIDERICQSGSGIPDYWTAYFKNKEYLACTKNVPGVGHSLSGNC